MAEETQVVETVEEQVVPEAKQPQDEKKYTDADVDAIIDKKFAKWKSEQEAEKSEAKKMAKMNEKEKADYEKQIKVILKDGMFVGDDGESRKYFPDGFATLVPNGNLGYTVFGTTPEQSDLLGGEATDANVSIVETGIAITTTKTTDPVNVQTKVSMIALPSFERLEEVHIINGLQDA